MRLGYQWDFGRLETEMKNTLALYDVSDTKSIVVRVLVMEEVSCALVIAVAGAGHFLLQLRWHGGSVVLDGSKWCEGILHKLFLIFVQFLLLLDK